MSNTTKGRPNPNTKVLPTKSEWSNAWAVTKSDFKENLIGFIGVILFFALLFAVGFAWQTHFSGNNAGSCYEGAPGASGVPVKQVECQ